MEKIKFLLKVLVSLGFIWFALSKVDFGTLGRVLLQANLFLIFISFLLYCFAMLVMALRWDILLKVFFNKISLWEVCSLFWIGLFFNLVLPSSVGGDAVKIYKLAKDHGRPFESAASVLMDRVIGLFSLTLLASVILIFFRNHLNFKAAENLLLILNIVLFAFFFLIFNKNAMKWFTFLAAFLSIVKLEKPAKDLYASFNFYKNHFDSLAKSVGVSLMINLITSVYLFLIAQAVGIKINIVYYFVIMPLVFIVTMIPISISGLGVQDGAYIFFLGQIGVNPTLAFSLSIVAHFTRYLTGLLGGLVYMLEKGKGTGTGIGTGKD